MKTIKHLILFLFILTTLVTRAQNPGLDSLFRVWNDITAQDTSRLNAIHEIALDFYMNSNPDSAFYYAQLQYDYARSKGLKKQMADALGLQGSSFQYKGNYPKALEYGFQVLKISEDIGDKKEIAGCLNGIGSIYLGQCDYPKALDYYRQGLNISEEISDKQGVSEALISIGSIYSYQGYNLKALDYYQRDLKIKEEIADEVGIAGSLNAIGIIYMEQGDFIKALEYFQQSARIYEENNSEYMLTFILNNMGNIYTVQEDYPKALEYFQRSLKIYERTREKHGIATTLIHIGKVYGIQGDYPKTLDYYQRSLKIYEEIPDKSGVALTLVDIGTIYGVQGDYSKALGYFMQSLKIKEEINDKDGLEFMMINIGRLYELQGNQKESILWYKKALQVAEELGSINTQHEACEYLYDTYKSLGDGNKALEYHEKMLVLTDSLNKEQTTEKLRQMEFAKQVLADSLNQAAKDKEVQHAHDAEVQKKNRTKNIAFGVGLLVLIVAIALYSRLRYTRRAKAIIEKEKDRSDNLLLNILPAEIAAELKEKGEAAARDFDMVSVLFTDFREFTQMSEKLNATELVAEINYCFKGFDGICEKYGIEKIKTIGDAYMAAGGLPIKKDDSTKNTVLAALEMADFIEKRKKEREASGQVPFEMRLGIHTGPVVAGIVGVKKFQYDIWGDTVNTASRMESAGEVGKVNVSQSTYDFIKNDAAFTFEPRGITEVKGKGKMKMWFVEKIV